MIILGTRWQPGGRIPGLLNRRVVAVEIAPDTKDWTWVLQRPCPECGLDTRTVQRGSVAGRLRDNAAEWAALLEGSGNLRGRPSPTVWSPLEYACHVRDVCRVFDKRLQLMLEEDDPSYPNWDQDATAVAERYGAQDPLEVAVELRETAEGLARRFDQVAGDQWDRTGNRSDGARFTVESFARYLIHDPIHHLFDVTGRRHGEAAGRVTPGDLERAVAYAVDAMRIGAHLDWSVPAGDLEWSCTQTVEHIASALISYAARLTVRAEDRRVPMDIVAEPGTSPDGLMTIMTATGGILSVVVRSTPDDVRAWHVYGMGDAEAFAAMGIVEVLVHTYDICSGLALPWDPSRDLCTKALNRLFPEAPQTGDRWQALLWAAGRIALPDRDRLTSWRWHNERA